MYIFIFRDPIDVIASATLRWKAPFDLKYILKKARFIPIPDLPYYSLKYIGNRFSKLISNEDKLSYWGPKYNGFEEDAKTKNILEISAIQWKKSVELSYHSFKKMDKSKYIAVDYNTFVSKPNKELERIITFLGLDFPSEKINTIVENVSKKSLGKGYTQLSSEQVNRVKEIVGNTYQNIKKEFLL